MSFGWTILFRKGAWDEYRRFALLQRQNVPDRILYIDREIAKIGHIKVTFEVSESDPNKRTERRAGLECEKGSALGKLLQAYIAQGGNPLDISMFLIPDSYEVKEDGTIIEEQPYGGMVYPMSGDPKIGEKDTKGWLNLWRYVPRKTGNNQSPWETYGLEIGARTESTKEWLNQEVSQLRNNLEARILKLCDLREQLMFERTELLQGAIGGTISDLDVDFTSHSQEHHLFSIINFIDSVFYNLDQYGRPNRLEPREDTKDRPYPTLLGDAPNGEEDFTAIG